MLQMLSVLRACMLSCSASISIKYVNIYVFGKYRFHYFVNLQLFFRA